MCAHTGSSATTCGCVYRPRCTFRHSRERMHVTLQCTNIVGAETCTVAGKTEVGSTMQFYQLILNSLNWGSLLIEIVWKICSRSCTTSLRQSAMLIRLASENMTYLKVEPLAGNQDFKFTQSCSMALSLPPPLQEFENISYESSNTYLRYLEKKIASLCPSTLVQTPNNKC